MNIVKEQLNINIVDTVFDPQIYGTGSDPKITPDRPLEVRYYKTENTSLYKIWIFLTGGDLPFVENVTYQLHESFPEPFRTVPRSLDNPDCRLVIWTWGIFQVNGTVLNKYGSTYSISHQLNYGNLLSKHSDIIKYVEENPDVSGGARLITA